MNQPMDAHQPTRERAVSPVRADGQAAPGSQTPATEGKAVAGLCEAGRAAAPGSQTPATESRAVAGLCEAGRAAAPGRRWPWIVGVVAIAAAGAFFYQRGRQNDPGPARGSPAPQTAALPVKTIFPRPKTLVRTVEQPGSVKAWSQVELYAKVSGYLKSIRRELPPWSAAEAVAHLAGGLAGASAQLPAAAAARWSASALEALDHGPQTNIGSLVREGDVLMVIDAPELYQDLAQKKAVWQQRLAELAQASTAIATAEATVAAAQAKQKQAETEVSRYAAEHAFVESQHRNLQQLAKDRAVPAELVKEKEFHVAAARANWDSAAQKVESLRAELAVVSSKLETARADLKVKEALVTVAFEDLHKAQILAEYTWLHAPFDGVITYRAVDEGDFIQNSSTGQTRHVMTVAAIDRVRVVMDIPAREAVWVRPGTRASVQIDGLPGRIEARVSRTSRSLDNQARTMGIEIDLDNHDHRLLPGMYCYVTLTLQEIPNARAVPATAVHSRSRGENYVIQVKDGVARRQRVRIRYDDGREVEVVKLLGDREVPLDGTEELVVSNKGEIADGQQVRPAPHGLDTSPPGGNKAAAREGRHDEKDLTGAPVTPGPARPAVPGPVGVGPGLPPRPDA